jgi:large subunit ribosomal protein L15
MTDDQTASGRGLKLHHLRPAPGSHKAKTRVGRGEASKGKTAAGWPSCSLRAAT